MTTHSTEKGEGNRAGFASALLDIEEQALSLDDTCTPTQITGLVLSLCALLRSGDHLPHHKEG